LNDFYHPFQQIWATGICRDFDKIKSWALGHQVERWKLDLEVDTRLKKPPV
jgi:hypothetical protein